MSNEQTVIKVRKHLAAHRTISRNLRLRRYQGRNSAATDQALTYHFNQADALLTSLPKALSGDLWAEHQLAGRLSQARDTGIDRPELRRRIASHRRDIKLAVAA